MGGGLLVGLGAGVVAVLLGLVLQGIDASLSTSADGGVVVLGNLLVGLLGRTSGGALDGLGDVVAGLLEGIHCDRCGWLGVVWLSVGCC